jgi:hypothetical protein
MQKCAINLAAMKLCCKDTKVIDDIISPERGSNITYVSVYRGIYGLVGNESFAA